MPALAALELALFIYNPLEGNYHHWGLHVYNRRTRAHRIFETEGSLTRSMQLLKRIVLGRIYEGRLARLVNIIRTVPMQNDVSSCDCQEYVIDIMDALEAGGFLGERSMPKYGAVKRAVKGMRGPVDLTRDAVVRYNYHLLREEESEEESDETEEEEKDEEQEERNVRSEESGGGE